MLQALEARTDTGSSRNDSERAAAAKDKTGDISIVQVQK